MTSRRSGAAGPRTSLPVARVGRWPVPQRGCQWPLGSRYDAVAASQVWGVTPVSQVLLDQADAKSQGLTTGASPTPVTPGRGGGGQLLSC